MEESLSLILLLSKCTVKSNIGSALMDSKITKKKKKKKNSKLRMVFDLHMQNKNTEKDVSPFLDQDTIRHDIMHATYRSKSDMSEA